MRLVWMVAALLCLSACGGGENSTSGAPGTPTTGASNPATNPPTATPEEQALPSADAEEPTIDDAPTFTFGALSDETVARTGAGQSYWPAATSAAVDRIGSAPFAHQLADGCFKPLRSNHCGHATLLMAAARLNPAAVENIAGCRGQVVGQAVLPLPCVKAALDRIQRSIKGLAEGTAAPQCGLATTPDELVVEAVRLFGLSAHSYRSQSAGDRPEARRLMRGEIERILDNGCLAGVLVQPQRAADKAGRRMVDHPSGEFRSGHWMLLVDQLPTQSPAAQYLVNDPFDGDAIAPIKAGQNPNQASWAYDAETVLRLAVDYQLTREDGIRTDAVIAFCPRNGPFLKFEQTKLPALTVGVAAFGLKVQAVPAGARFSADKVAPGLTLQRDGTITGTPLDDGVFEFEAIARFTFGGGSASAGQSYLAAQTFFLTVNAAEPDFGFVKEGKLGTAPVGEVRYFPLPNFVNKAATFIVESGPGEVVGDALRVLFREAGNLRIKLQARSTRGETAVGSFTLTAYASEANAEPVGEISAVSPASPTATGESQRLTLTATAVSSGVRVEFTQPDGKLLSTVTPTAVALSATSTIQVDVDLGTAAGTWRVALVNRDGRKGEAFPFQVRRPASSSARPTISGVSPSAVIGSNSKQPFTVIGANFEAGAQVLLHDETEGRSFPRPDQTSFSSTRISLSVTFTTEPNNWSVEVVNPDGQSSGRFRFRVQRPPATQLRPSISSVSPNPVIGDAGAQPFVINGENFAEGANIILRDVTANATYPMRVPTSFTSSRIALSVRFTALPNAWTVEVVNPGGLSSGSFAFNVRAPAAVGRPIITSVSPNPVIGSSAKQPFTINGSGFGTDPRIVLRDETEDETFPSPVVTSQSAVRIALSVNFTTAMNNWSVEVISAGQSSGRFKFRVTR